MAISPRKGTRPSPTGTYGYIGHFVRDTENANDLFRRQPVSFRADGGWIAVAGVDRDIVGERSEAGEAVLHVELIRALDVGAAMPAREEDIATENHRVRFVIEDDVGRIVTGKKEHVE